MGALTGSRASTEPLCGVSALTGFDPERLREIATECEMATAQESRGLLLIARDAAMPAPKDVAEWLAWRTARSNFQFLIDAGAFLDAALTLVPGEDWEFSLERETDSAGEMFARCRMGDPARHRDCEARTLPLALCAAALRARAAIATEARRAETVKQGSVHEGAGPKDIAQGTPHD
jgi:hypothetical protein